MNQTLNDYLRNHPPFALAFSGGVDSSYLLYAAAKSRCKMTAYFIKSPFQPQFELEDARRLAHQLNAPLKVLELDILDKKEITANPKDRCYHCKKALFSALAQQAQADGYSIIFDGTNASDQADDRPGMRALRELQVRSPLRECRLTKEEIRHLSREAGLFTHDKPSYACLATRIPTGTQITGDLLQKIETAEHLLSQLGYRDFRIRLLGSYARLQLPDAQFSQALQQKEQLVQLLSPYFDGVLLDLIPRKGAD